MPIPGAQELLVFIPGLGLPELLVILLIIVIIFGASKLPQLGKGLGEGIRFFKKGLKGDDEPTSPEEIKNSSQE